MIKILILAGGFGTRLKSVVSDVPKPLAPISNSKRFLDFQIENIRSFFQNDDIYLLTYYMSSEIEEYYKNDTKIKIIKEPTPLGTGGSIKNAINILNLNKNDRIIVLNGDTYIRPNFDSFINHLEGDINIVASFQEDCSRYGSLNIKNGKIVEFKEKDKNCRNSYINAGCYFFKKLDIFFNTLDGFFSLETLLSTSTEEYIMKAFLYKDIFIDIGIPEDYEKMIKYIGGQHG